MKQITTNFTEYASILEAEVVTIHTLVGYFKKEQMDYDEHGNIFIGFRKETRGLPILVAHLDNVLHGERTPVWSLNGRRLMGKTAGIGFDDKAGIIAIIQLWKAFRQQQFRIIFTTDEETGGVGAKAMDKQRIKDAAWILELDRKNGNNFIQKSGCTRLCSDAFAQKFIELGFKKEQGTFTDVNVFKEYAENVNMANLSIGYYNPHTDSEYLDTVEFDNIINKVAGFIQAKFTFEDDKKDTYTSSYNRNPSWVWGDDGYSRQPSRWNNCWCCGKDTLNRPEPNGEVFCSKECKDEYDDIMKDNEDVIKR